MSERSKRVRRIFGPYGVISLRTAQGQGHGWCWPPKGEEKRPKNKFLGSFFLVCPRSPPDITSSGTSLSQQLLQPFPSTSTSTLSTLLPHPIARSNHSFALLLLILFPKQIFSPSPGLSTISQPKNCCCSSVSHSVLRLSSFQSR